VLIASDLLLCYSQHLLVVLHQQVKAVPLELIQRPIESIVVLDLVLKVLLEIGLRLPGRLAVGQAPPLYEVELIYIVLVCDGSFYVFLCEGSVLFQLFKRFPWNEDPVEVILTRVYDGRDNWSQILCIIDLEIVIVPLINHLGLNHGGSLRLLRAMHLLIGSHRHCEAALLLPVITLVEWVELRLLLI